VRQTNHFHLVSRLKRENCVSKTLFKHVSSWRVNRQLDLSYDLSVDDLMTSLKGRNFKCITTTFSSQNQQVMLVTALGYQVKYLTTSHNCIFRQYIFSKISDILSEKTIVMDCPFLYFDIHASEWGVFVFDNAFYCCRRNVCPYRRNRHKYTFKWMLFLC
jgi:hypothetical protein